MNTAQSSAGQSWELSEVEKRHTEPPEECSEAISPTTLQDRDRLLRMTDAEWAVQATQMQAALDSMDDMTDESDTDELWETFERNIDEDRRTAGMRTLFEGGS